MQLYYYFLWPVFYKISGSLQMQHKRNRAPKHKNKLFTDIFLN